MPPCACLYQPQRVSLDYSGEKRRLGENLMLIMNPTSSDRRQFADRRRSDAQR